MAKSVKALLNKKGWTGQEVGQLLIASALHDIKERGAGKPLFSPDQFNKIERSLTTDRERLIYGVYRDLYGSIINLFNRTQGLNQQFYNGFNYLYGRVQVLMQIQEEEKASLSQPLIMTQEQYDRAKAQIEQETRAHTECVYSLMIFLIQAYVEGMTTPTEAVQEALEATKEEPATNKRILSTYSQDTGYGYYELPDGRRSDQMEKKEWQKAIFEGRPFDGIDEEGMFTLNGEPVPVEQVLLTNTDSRTSLQTYMYKHWGDIEATYKKAGGEALKGGLGADEEDTLRELETVLGRTHPLIKKLRGFLYTSNTTWIYHDTPDDLTKYELLYYSLERYQGILEGDSVEDCYKEFVEDYPSLFQTLKKDIEAMIPKAKGLDPLEEFITWGELADLGIEEYKRLVAVDNITLTQAFVSEEDTTDNLTKRERVGLGGIAIIQDPKDWQVDNNGDYKELKLRNSLSPALEKLAESTDAVETIQQNREGLVYPALSQIYAYNTLLEILGETYDLPDLAKVARLDTTDYEYRMGAYNAFLAHYFFTLHGADKDLEKKRGLVRAIFEPLDPEEAKPSREAIEAVTEEIRELGLTYEARKKLPYLDEYILALAGGNK